MPLDSVILEIIQSERISNQQNLVSSLEQKGYNLNQSTLSRHLRKLRIHKSNGYYQVSPDKSNPSSNAASRLVKEVKIAPPNLVFIQALPGHAGAVGYYLDQLDLRNIVGTVAGDDTLLVAVSPPEELQQVLSDIKSGLGLEED